MRDALYVRRQRVPGKRRVVATGSLHSWIDGAMGLGVIVAVALMSALGAAMADPNPKAALIARVAPDAGG